MSPWYIDYLINVERLTYSEVSERLEIGKSALRTSAKVHDIRKRNDHPEFLRKIQEYDDSTDNRESLDMLSVRFRVGRANMKLIVPERSPRGQSALSLRIEEVKEFSHDHNIHQISHHFGVSKLAVQKFCSEHDIQINTAHGVLIDSIIELIKQGLSNIHIAGELSVNSTMVRNIRKTRELPKVTTQSKINYTRIVHGVDFYSQTIKQREISRTPTRELDEVQLRELTEQGMSNQQLSRHFKCSDITIAKRKKILGLECITKDQYLKNSKDKSLGTFVTKANNKFGQFKYNTEQWNGMNTPITINCPTHGDFKSTPSNHIQTAYGCIKCSNTGPSKVEQSVANYVKSLGEEVEQSNRTLIHPKELDIVVHKHKLAIEMNGAYWHSSGNTADDNKFRNKHVLKTEKCNQLGYNLLQITDIEWNCSRTRQIWKGIISRALGKLDVISVKDCTFQLCTRDEAKLFCQNNHINGYGRSSVFLALVQNEEILQMLTLKKITGGFAVSRDCCNSSIHIRGSWELLRWFSSMNSGVVKWRVNRRWSQGDEFTQTPFNTIPPSWVYLSPSNEITKRSNEPVQTMYKQSYRRLWDCGHIEFKTK